MTVAELISKLQTFSPEAKVEVWLTDADGEDYLANITDVTGGRTDASVTFHADAL